MRRAGPVRRAAAGADPARRLGLPDPPPRAGPRPPPAPGSACGRRLPGARDRAPPIRPGTLTASVLGIADDQALGGSLRLVVTDPRSLRAAKAAVDEVIEAIDAAASRFREDSELSRLNATPEREVVVSPLLGQAIAAALRGAQLTEG